MAPRSNSFTAVATALVVLVANLACVCRAHVAKAAEPAESAAHGCCKHEAPTDDQPRQQPTDSDEPCRHCSGPAASFTTGQSSAGGTADAVAHPTELPPAPAAFDAAASRRCDPAAHPTSTPIDRSASTLLGLRCALTL